MVLGRSKPAPPPPVDLADLPPPPTDYLAGLGAEDGAWASVPLGQTGLRLLLVRYGGRVLQFLNRCPHAGHPLEMATGEIWAANGRQLECGSHSARFSLPDGRCVAGPCKGAFLRRVRDD